jgi:hypothetical protein
MSRYDDDRRSRHQGRDRYDDYDDTRYDDRDAKSTTIVRRRRDDSVSSVEEVTRDFPPGEGRAIYRETTVRKSGHRPVGGRTKSYDDDYYEDDRYDDRSSYSRRTRRGPKDDDTYVSRRSSRRYDERGKHLECSF